MTSPTTLSILISTYNRARMLEATLEAFCKLDTKGLRVTWIIIDNNSDDHTPSIVASFAERLNIVALFEPRPGKNCALNKALDECPLNEIVVFADDDITPEADWLQQIARSCRETPSCDVFGGRIQIQWPEEAEPSWAQDRYIQMLGYSLHDFGDKSLDYPPLQYPFGANFWVRRSVVGRGYRFDTRVGPRPKNRIMGSETTFLHKLAQDGYRMQYFPSASIRHRIEPNACTPAMVRRRAFRLGRADVYLIGIPRLKLRKISTILWRAFLVAKLANASMSRIFSCLQLSEEKRLLHAVQTQRVIGHAWEAWRADKRTNQ